MILIADSGSTKTDWCVVEQGKRVKTVTTKGINPFFESEEEISNEIRTALAPQLPPGGIEAIYFYGAGCAFADKIATVERALRRELPTAGSVEINSDLLAAARALCGHRNGIACILGTGSNSCYYDGRTIVDNISPLGFILGDEGSGACLGKLLVGDLLKNQLPPALKAELLEELAMEPADIIDRVYRQPFPNRFLAGLSPFVARHIGQAGVRTLVLESFRTFLRRNVMQYNYRQHPVHFVGSVAYHYRDLLAEAAAQLGMQMGTVLKSPMEGLVEYHTTKPMFVKITEQSSLYNDLERKSVREILEEINTEDRKVATAVSRVLPQIEALVVQIVPRMKQGGRIFYLGAGTSGRLGVLDASEVPPTFGMAPTHVIGLIAGGDTALRNPVEGAEDDTTRGWEELVERGVSELDTVIGIAASGTTPYVVGALKAARAHGILTACIASNPHSPMAVAAEIAIEMVVGPEYVTGSSRMKSGTGQKMILNMISTAVMIQLGRVKGNRMVNMQLSNQKLIDRGTRMIMDELGLAYDPAQELLLLHGSVKKAVDTYKATGGK